jgi:hypothetical protein
MIKDALKRFKIRDQLSADFLKLLSLAEKTVLAFMLIVLVFVFMEKIGLTDTFLVGAVIGGTIGFLTITAKKMYHNEAFSELRIYADIKQDMLKSAILTIDYSERKDGVYYPKKRIFSIFYCCKSEAITHKTQNGIHIFTGPHNRLLKLSNIILQGPKLSTT